MGGLIVGTSMKEYVQTLKRLGTSLADIAENARQELEEAANMVVKKIEWPISAKDLQDKFGGRLKEGDIFEDPSNKIILDYIKKDFEHTMHENKIDLQFMNVEFIEFDSGNISHAGAYYSITIKGSIGDLQKFTDVLGIPLHDIGVVKGTKMGLGPRGGRTRRGGRRGR